MMMIIMIISHYSRLLEFIVSTVKNIINLRNFQNCIGLEVNLVQNYDPEHKK
jgi:hypothetical protein